MKITYLSALTSIFYVTGCKSELSKKWRWIGGQRRSILLTPSGQLEPPEMCEPTVPQVEPIFDSVIKTYYKLQELGIQEVNGKIVFIDNMEVDNE